MAIGITGGGGHIGSALALGLASIGARVLIVGRHKIALDDCLAEYTSSGNMQGELLAEVGDIGDAHDLEHVMRRLESLHNRIDGWVNCASQVSEDPGPSQSRSDVIGTITTTLVNTIIATQEVARRMIATGGGSIVNIASMYGIVSPHPNIYEDLPAQHSPPGYGAAKAGIIQFSRYAACHYAPCGIRVNSLSPGAFPRESVQSEIAFMDQLQQHIPLGRVGTPVELVGPVAFLLSASSSYVTGHNLVVDGGWTAW